MPQGMKRDMSQSGSPGNGNEVTPMMGKKESGDKIFSRVKNQHCAYNEIRRY
jgi:hypothetical protein